MDDILDVFVLPTQRQNNGTDCGCHAVATAVEFLHEDGDPTADFAVERIRELACLENDSFEPQNMNDWTPSYYDAIRLYNSTFINFNTTLINFRIILIIIHICLVYIFAWFVNAFRFLRKFFM